jgi:hypothetical protein
MNRIDLIPYTIIACCVLHNICLDHNDLLIDDYIREGMPFIQHNDEIEQDAVFVLNGQQRRDNLARELFDVRRV